MTRNFGAGHRDMKRAAEMVLDRARQDGQISYGTQARYQSGWTAFVDWAKERGINRMESIDREDLLTYGKELATRVDDGELSVPAAQNSISGINRVLQLAGADWKSVSPTKECGIPERIRFRDSAPETLSRTEYEARLQTIKEQLSPRSLAVCELAREFGLRSKEASLLNAQQALKQAQEKGVIRIDDGTKGGRIRELPAASPEKLAVLQRACDAQGGARAVMPASENWKSWRDGELSQARQIMGGLHELRAAYACERYQALIGHAAPCTGGQILDREAEREVRLVLADELGHGRIDVVAAYVGSRK